jgi:hypothetical protein
MQSSSGAETQAFAQMAGVFSSPKENFGNPEFACGYAASRFPFLTHIKR